MRELIWFDEQQLETIYPMTRGQKLNSISSWGPLIKKKNQLLGRHAGMIKKKVNLEDNLVKEKLLASSLGWKEGTYMSFKFEP